MADYNHTPISSGYNTTASINNELQAVETAVASKLDESGGVLGSDLDVNSRKLLNVADGTNSGDGVNYAQLVEKASMQVADAKFYDTVLLAQADTTLVSGDVVIIKERASALFDVITGTGSANGFDIIAHGSLSLSFSLRVDGAANIVAFGAVEGGVVDITQALDSIIALTLTPTIYFPAGQWLVKEWIISKPCTITGAGIDETKIIPNTSVSDSVFVIASDNITITELGFQQRNASGSSQSNIYGTCIELNAVKGSAAFTRHMEGVNIHKVKFRNLKMNGIFIPHLLRESFITECRFLGMGDVTNDFSCIKAENSIGNASNNNNLWIRDNSFYRFETPLINFKKSTLITNLDQPHYSDIKLAGNLLHGQLLDETAAVETVQAGASICILIEQGTDVFLLDNKITAQHAQFPAVKITGVKTTNKAFLCIGNRFSVKGTIGGVTYSRAIGNATGSVVDIENTKSVVFTNNVVQGSTYNIDIDIKSTSTEMNAGTVKVTGDGNTTESGDILFSVPSNWTGIYLSENIIYKNGQTKLQSTGQTTPAIAFGNTTTGFDGTGGGFISTAVDGTLVQLEYAASVRPFPSGTRSLGTNSQAWGSVNSVAYKAGGVAGVSGTFTTSDSKTVTVTSGIITSIV